MMAKTIKKHWLRCLGFGLFAFCQVGVSSWASLPTQINDALSLAGLDEHHFSVVVAPALGGVPILSHLADMPRTPASTQKLVSTAVALDVLGADFVWHNRIYHTGVLAGGVLHGDVILVGSGDPSLDYQKLNALLNALRGKVRHIDGDIYIDNHRFVDVGYDPNAFDGQGSRAYNAEPSAFLVNFGTIELKFTPSGRYRVQTIDGVLDVSTDDETDFYPNTSADEAVVQMYPRLDGITVPKRILVNHQNCKLPSVAIQQTQIGLSGTFGANCGVQSVWRNFGNNNSLAIKAVKARWRRLDPSFAGKVKIANPSMTTMIDDKLPLVSVPSRPMSEQIAQINQFSNNVMTEQLALSLPIYAGGLSSSNYDKTFFFIRHWWRQNLDTPPPIMSRASGLCRDCQIAPLSLSSLLQLMYRHRDFEYFLASLPVAGKTGTMANLAQRDNNHPAIGRAWIKTGTLNDVSAMAGYIQGDSGKTYVMVAMINAKNAGYNPKAIKVLDELLAWTSHR